ncbi:MAG: Uma2 family endonuclease [Actinomycetota bacterium]
MATEPKTTGLTYEDLWDTPDDDLRRELIAGELFVTAAPTNPHQRVVTRLLGALLKHAEQHGGEVFAGAGVYYTESNFVIPDVLYVTQENLSRVEDLFVRSGPDLVVEVSSPSTRKRDVTLKKDLYERFEVPEYWFVDLDAERIEAYRLSAGRYGKPLLVGRGETIEPKAAAGLVIVVEDLLSGPASGA